MSFNTSLIFLNNFRIYWYIYILHTYVIQMIIFFVMFFIYLILKIATIIGTQK